MEVKFNRSCSGDVFLYSEGQRRPVSADGWKNEEGHRLCSDLQCDNLVSVNRRKSTVALWNSNIRCRGVNNTENIWDCENKMVTTAKEQKEQLVIECEGKNKTTQNCSLKETICNSQFTARGRSWACAFT